MTSPKHRQTRDAGVIKGEPIRSDAEDWIKIGYKLLEESMQVSREYAKFMVQFSFGAIPLYIALVNFIGKSTISITTLGFTKALVVLSPIFLYLISGIVFIIAYYPVPGEVVVHVVEAIRDAHQKLLRRRRRVNLVATFIFTLAVLLSAVILFFLE